MNRLHFLLICGWMAWGPLLLSGQVRFVPGEILIGLKEGVNPAQLRPSAINQPIHWISEESVTRLGNIWRIRFDTTLTDSDRLLQYFRKNEKVRSAQYNHYVEERSAPKPIYPDYLPDAVSFNIPDDPNFQYQWYLNNNGQSGGAPGTDIGALDAWDITTGGVTPAGDTVVVAVIDGGICPYCNELGTNLWVNKDEIPNDGIDNDQNGYFDDYKGWNVNAQNDNILGYSPGHGTSVSGIIGARGNNGIGIAGVMWSTKIMFVAGTSGSQTSESEILAAYEYVWSARKLYNETNGQKGAYVVAVNCSFGINFNTPNQSPLWCEILDQLGEQGILTIGASANGPWNVDEVGDIPTTCPSDYLITTTSLDFEDHLSTGASWGPVSVDLGAYGSNIYTLTVGTSNYGIVSGTSFAAPQVSGAIGLLFTAPCHNLISLSKTNAGVGALTAKNILLSSVRPNASISGLTTSNGKLHLFDMLQNYQNKCELCPQPYWLKETHIDSNTIKIHWVATQETDLIDLRWRASGTGTWNEIAGIQSPYQIQNLKGCTAYEYSLHAVCDSTTSSSWTPVRQFITEEGCCKMPSIISSSPTSHNAIIRWKPITAAQYYNVKYKIQPGNTWETVNYITTDSLLIENLEPCSMIEVKIQSYCASGLTTFSEGFDFQTIGCGACYDKVYCSSTANHASEEWIQRVEIGADWAFDSYGFQGYQDFTGATDVPELTIYPEQTLQATIYPEFLGLTFKEMFRIFIDFNLDGDFSDPGELVFDPGWAHDGPMTGDFITPYFTSEGISKMRVIMKFKASGSLNLPQPCETFEYGQVEDYCVHLKTQLSTTITSPDENENIGLTIFPNPATREFWVKMPELPDNDAVNITIHDVNGNLVRSVWRNTTNGDIVAEDCGTLPSGIYFVKLLGSGQKIYRGKLVKLED